MTPEEYHASDGLSNSMMTRLLRSPAHLKHYIDHPDAPTPQMILGTQVHTALLEPDVFADLCVVGPYGPWTRKAAKDEIASMVDAGYNKSDILKPDVYDQIHDMVDSVLGNPSASLMIRSGRSEGKIEESLFWADPGTHVECKARVDCIPAESSMYSNYLVDFKTTIDASPESFAKSVVNFGYHRQAYHYLSGWNSLHPEDQRKGFIIIACEKSPPYAVAIYEMSDQCMELGKHEVSSLLELYARCDEDDVWESYPPTVQMLELPAWATAKVGQ